MIVVGCSKRLSLDHDSRADFCLPQWNIIPLPVFLVFRIIEAVALTAGVFYGYVISAQYGMGLAQFCYLTVWTYYIATVFHIAAAVCTFMALVQQMNGRLHQENGGETHRNRGWCKTETNRDYEPLNRIHVPNWLLRVTWFCFHVSLSWSPVVAIVYWSFLHGYLELDSMAKRFYNIQIHAVPGATMILELLISSIPVRMAHFLYPYLVGVVYVVFNLLYCLSGALDPITGENELYIFLDWFDDLGTCFLSLLMISIALIFIYIVLYIINICKLKFVRWTKKETLENQVDMPTIATVTEA